MYFYYAGRNKSLKTVFVIAVAVGAAAKADIFFLTVRRLIPVDRYKLQNPVDFSWKTRYLFNLKKIKFNLQRPCFSFYTSYTNHVRWATDDVRIRV